MKATIREFVAAALVFASAPALAQSDKLLEAVRLHDATARSTADAELAACEKAQCAELPRLNLLAGYLALSDGDAERGWTLLSAHPAPKGLEPWAQFYLGQAQFYRRHYDAAAKAFDAATRNAPESLRLRATARLGEAWLMAGNAAAALPNLEQAANGIASPELYFERAQARKATGNLDGARADWVLLAVKFPDHPYGAEALEQLNAQKHPYRFSFEERQQRAIALLNAGRTSAAASELDAIDEEKLARGATAKAKLAYARALTSIAQGKADDAETWIDRAMKGPRSLASQAAMLRARQAMRKSDRDTSRALLAAVAKKFPREPEADDALYLAAWLDLQEARFEESVKTFTELEKRYPRSRKLDEALWFKALAQLQLKDFPAAQATLLSLQTRFPRSSLVPQAKYWWARAAQLAGAKPEELSPKYTEVVNLFPGSFYALLSQVRLKELGVEPPPAFPNKCAALEEQVPPELSRAVALSRTGLFRDARDEVDEQLSKIRDPAVALKFGHALQHIGQFGSAYSLAARLLWGTAYGDKKPEAVALLYPRAFRSAVERESKKQKVSEWLVWAIMRRESAFRPDVSSPADARGLMQLIPPTATAIAHELGDKAPPPDSLFAPEVNIHYGAWYLARLWDRFGHPALIAAAYNAGPNAVLKWVKNQKALPLDLFVELIPYKETRGYVKQVVTDFHLYQALYGDKDDGLKVLMNLPEPKADGVSF